MSNLVVVPNVFDDFYWNSNAIESIRYACKQWNANLFELKTFMGTSDKIHSGITSNRLWMMKYFTDFDKVLILDPDIVVNSKSTNIFDDLVSMILPEYIMPILHEKQPMNICLG